MKTSEESDLEGAVVLVAEGVGVLRLQGVVGFLQGEELVALQEEVLVQQEQAEQPAQMELQVEASPGYLCHQNRGESCCPLFSLTSHSLLPPFLLPRPCR